METMRILNQKEFIELKAFLNTCELDPTFLNYGGFLKEVKNYEYHKEYRNKIQKYLGFYKVWFSSQMYSFDKENGYNLLINSEQKKEVEEIIKERQKETEYKIFFNSLFNCFSFEYTIYSDDLIEKLSNKNWYLVEKMQEYLHLDATEKEAEKLKEKTENECKKRIALLENKGIKILGYEVRKYYKNFNFTPEEFEYIKTKIVNRNNHPTHQITRRLKTDVKHRLNDFKEYVLEPTKRKALISVDTWGLSYIEIEKPQF